MWRATLKSLYSHRLRLMLTTLAVVLGVGFIVGTLVLSDTMRAAFADAFGELTGEVDVQVRGETEFGANDERKLVPAAVVKRIKRVGGWRRSSRRFHDGYDFPRGTEEEAGRTGGSQASDGPR